MVDSFRNEADHSDSFENVDSFSSETWVNNRSAVDLFGFCENRAKILCLKHNLQY